MLNLKQKFADKGNGGIAKISDIITLKIQLFKIGKKMVRNAS